MFSMMSRKNKKQVDEPIRVEAKFPTQNSRNVHCREVSRYMQTLEVKSQDKRSFIDVTVGATTSTSAVREPRLKEPDSDQHVGASAEDSCAYFVISE